MNLDQIIYEHVKVSITELMNINKQMRIALLNCEVPNSYLDDCIHAGIMNLESELKSKDYSTFTETVIRYCMLSMISEDWLQTQHNVIHPSFRNGIIKCLEHNGFPIFTTLPSRYFLEQRLYYEIK